MENPSGNIDFHVKMPLSANLGYIAMHYAIDLVTRLVICLERKDK
jgi:hypothetical protein